MLSRMEPTEGSANRLRRPVTDSAQVTHMLVLGAVTAILLVLAPGAATPVRAQSVLRLRHERTLDELPSHVHVPGGDGPADLEEKLAPYRSHRAQSELLRKIFRSPDSFGLKPGDLPKLGLSQALLRGPFDPNDPRIREFLQKLLHERAPSGQSPHFDDQQRELLENLLKERDFGLPRSHVEPHGEPPPSKPETTTPPPPEQPDPEIRPPETPSAKTEGNKAFGEFLLDMAKHFKSNEKFQQNQSLQEFARGVQRLLDSKAKGDQGGSRWPTGLGNFKMPKSFGKLPALPWDRLRGNLSPNLLGKLPSLPSLRPPTLGMGTGMPRLPSFGTSEWRLPRVQTSGWQLPGGGTGGVNQSLWTLALVAVLGVGGWWLWRRRRPSVRSQPVIPLGDWPVAPSRISTAAELQAAFEYLALLRLGPAARARHHHDLAAGLGGADALRDAAARRLSGLYEVARYAPTSSLAAESFVIARRDLCFLGGVPAS